MHVTYCLRGDISSKDDWSTTIKIVLLEGDLKLRQSSKRPQAISVGGI